MADSNERKIPPGRKGGTQFPRIPLIKAVEYSKRLVAKTHNGPQPANIILPGVFGSGTSRGSIRASALKQFGLMQGPAEAYEASKLAREIESSPAEELMPLLRTACLKPTVFKTLYETFQSDTVHISKIRQQAPSLHVHPESGDECVLMFVESLAMAGLARRDQDQVEIFKSSKPDSKSPSLENDVPNGEHDVNSGESEVSYNQNPSNQDGEKTGADKKDGVQPPANSNTSRPPVQINLDVDSHTDTDKLEKQLRLLRQYGVL